MKWLSMSTKQRLAWQSKHDEECEQLQSIKEEALEGIMNKKERANVCNGHNLGMVKEDGVEGGRPEFQSSPDAF